MRFKEKQVPVLITILIFGLIYSVISLVNHYNFRSNAHDLGIYNNAIYDYAHFKMNHDPLVGTVGNIFADHFEILLLFFSPLYWFFGSYTLLLIQIAVILFGGYGIYLLVKNRTTHPSVPLLAMIHFFTLWGIYSALSFDYHNNVVGAMFVPWLFYYFAQNKFKPAALFFILILISKENMALWAGFLAIGLLLLNYKDRGKQRFSLFSGLLAFAYFYVIMNWVMPAFSSTKSGYFHFEFSALGNNFGDAIKNIFLHPQHTFALLFENPGLNSGAYGIKSELYFTFLLSGGFALLLRPAYLVMLLPVFGQKLFNDNFERWGVNYHYSIEFVPVLTIGLFDWIISKKDQAKQPIIAAAFLLLTIAATINSMDKPVSTLYFSEPKQFYKKRHYETPYKVQHVYDALKLIPDNARVSAQSMLVPHLAFRDYIRLFPNVEDADYIALLNSQNPYPASSEVYELKLMELCHSAEWQKIYDDGQVIVFRKNR